MTYDKNIPIDGTNNNNIPIEGATNSNNRYSSDNEDERIREGIIYIIKLTMIMIILIILIKRLMNIKLNIFQTRDQDGGIIDDGIFTSFEFNPNDRFDINEDIKYGWMINGGLIIVLSLLIGI